MTLEEALRLPVLKPAKLFSETELVREREITGVSVIEVPVDRFIRRGDFVLSTGIDVGRNAKLLVRFVEEIAGCGASALALAIGPHTPRIPKSVTSTANRLQFPLIALPWELRFSEISEVILRRLIEEAAQRQSSRDFVWALANGTVEEKTAQAEAIRLGLNLKRNLVGIFAMIRNSGFADPKSEARTVEILSGKMAARQHLHWLGTVAGNSVLGFLQMPHRGSHVQTLLKSVSNDQRCPVSWGIGRHCNQLADFPRSYEDARNACEIGIRLRGEGSITDVSDVVADRLLFELAPRVNGTVWKRYIEPLSQLHRIVPLKTLEEFFRCDCNVSEAARRLSITRQSLLYRLSKIESALDIDLHSSEHRFAVNLALRLHKLQGG